MTKGLKLDLPTTIESRLQTMASEAQLTIEELAGAIITSFVENGGKVYAGKWKEGPGLRVLPDWPRFSSGVIKLKK